MFFVLQPQNRTRWYIQTLDVIKTFNIRSDDVFNTRQIRVIKKKKVSNFFYRLNNPAGRRRCKTTKKKSSYYKIN